MDFSLFGEDVTKVLMQTISSDVSIPVHSMNPGDAPKMVMALTKAGFSVTRLPMSVMS
jgi:hypothetical protein